MSWRVTFSTGYELKFLSDAEIIKSVENLADTAFVRLPQSIMNKPIVIDDRIKRGTGITIKLGYDNNLITEFEGYVLRVVNTNGSLTIECEDFLFNFRKPVADRVWKAVTLKEIAQYTCDQLGKYEVITDYDIGYESFVLSNVTGLEVLKNLQDSTRANIYLQGSELHIHAPYAEKGLMIGYDLQRNVEKTALEWKDVEQRPVKIVVEKQGKDGKITRYTAGKEGGNQVTLKRSSLEVRSLQQIADSELLRRTFTGYEGSITGWLVPYCKPTDLCRLIDKEEEYKSGTYYINGVTTKFSENGGSREVFLGIKVS